MIIAGAGLTGLITATQFPNACIFEARAEASEHNALLRFRSPDVGKATGITFRKVRVHKAIWSKGHYHDRATLEMMNRYSMKVANRYMGRSLTNLDPVDRWIAPHDFVQQLADQLKHRISYLRPVTNDDFKEPIISTIPMFELAKIVGETAPEFCYAPIRVARYKIEGADIFQTVYFPDTDTKIYRASVTGDTLIVESMDRIKHSDVEKLVFPVFGFYPYEANAQLQTAQRFGKIAPIDESWRQAFILRMTAEHGIFSVGRFAVWRNILLDDVLIDIERVKQMMQMGSYHRFLKGAAK